MCNKYNMLFALSWLKSVLLVTTVQLPSCMESEVVTEITYSLCYKMFKSESCSS